MKKTAILILVFTSFGLQKSTAQHFTPYTLVGTWTNNDTIKTIGEKWEMRDSTELQGYGFKIAHGKERIIEKLMLKRMNDDWLYIAKTGNQNPIAFTLKPQTEANKLTFINLEHDYPQVIEYTLEKDNSVSVLVSDIKRKKFVAFVFYRK